MAFLMDLLLLMILLNEDVLLVLLGRGQMGQRDLSIRTRQNMGNSFVDEQLSHLPKKSAGSSHADIYKVWNVKND